MSPRLYAVILAGGSGTRLWPLSTREHPKQFLSLGLNSSLLQQTWARVAGWIPDKNGWVVCGKAHAAGVREQIPKIPGAQILAEPEAKNTAAAIAWAALHLHARDPDAVMIVLPADHFIPQKDWPNFRKNFEAAAGLADREKLLVTLGIRPSEAATGFGYIERGAAVSGHSGFNVRAFHEKPSLATAERYAADPAFFWNSGMFVWRADVFLEEVAKYLPELSRGIESLRSSLNKRDEARKTAEVFSALSNISVDYGVLEKSKRVAVLPAEFGWDDVGALTSLAAMGEADTNGNSHQGEIFSVDASNNLIVSRGKPVAILGVNDLMVIEGEKAILVLPKARAQEVRDVVRVIKEAGRDDLL